MLGKVLTLLQSKVALAVVGAVLVGGTGTAAAVAATTGHLPLGNGTGTAKETPDASTSQDNHGHTVSIEGVLKGYDAGAKTISVLARGDKSATTVDVDDNTRVNGEQASKLSDLTKNIGHGVQVQATKQSNGSLLAWKVTVQGAEPEATDTGQHEGQDNGDGKGTGSTSQQREARGTVSSVGASSFVVTTADGTKVTVDVNNTTRYDGAAHQLSDVKVGMRVTVEGTSQSNGSLLASSIEASTGE